MQALQLYRPYYKSNLKLAIPVIISQLGQQTIQLVDTVMVGRISSDALASVSLANSVCWPVILLGMGLAMGLTPLVGRSHVRGDFNRTTSLLKNSLFLNTLFGVGITIVLMGGSLLLDKMGQDPRIIPLAQEYYFWMVISALPIMWYSTARQFLEGIGNTTYSMVIVISTNLLNVVLNFALIYGLWFFPEMGPVGAGVSTFISRAMQVVLFAMLFIEVDKYRQYFKKFKNATIDSLLVRRLFNIGFPISIQIFIEMAALSLMAIAVGMFSAQALAAHQIAINIPSTAFMAILGLQAATTIKVSQNYGLRRYDEMRKSLIASQHLIVGFMLVSAVVIVLFAEQIASAFTTEPEVIAMAVNFLYLGAVFQLPDGIQGVGLGALRGLMVVKVPMYYALGIYIFVAIPVAYLCSYPLGMGPYGTWVGFIVALTIFAVLFNRLFMKRVNQLKVGSKIS